MGQYNIVKLENQIYFTTLKWDSPINFVLHAAGLNPS